MIPEQLQQMALAYIVAKYQESGWGADQLSAGGWNVSKDGVDLRITKGLSDEEQALPLVTVYAEDAQEDYETGNEYVTLTLAVHVAADVSGAYAMLETHVDLLKQWWWQDTPGDLREAINAVIVGTFDCLIIGLTDRQVASSFDGRMRKTELSLRLYCAALESA